ncbi:MAG: glycosyltransferase family 39 protein, partial [Chloroflexi bacterium]|nr:glycosyltransferase family 39 protein [Chloroflexota bacterium]
MSRPRLCYPATASLLALVAFATRAISLDAQSLWRDEVDALRFATVSWSEMLASFTRPGWNGPLYYLLLRGWVALAGTSEYALRFFSLLLGVLGVPLIYALARRLFDRPTGLLAALLLATSPYLAWYGQEVKMYTLVPALALLAIYALRRALSPSKGRAVEGGNWRWWAVTVAATSLAFYSHILAALLIPVQILLYFIWWPQSRHRWRGALVSLACLTLPYLPLLAWQVPLLLQERATGFAPYTLGKMVETLLNGWSLGMLGWGWRWGVVLMGSLAAWGLTSPLFLPQTEGVRDRFALTGWLLPPLLAVWLI